VVAALVSLDRFVSYLGLVAKERHKQMLHRRKSLGAALVAVTTAGSLALMHSPAEADFSPQPKDVVSTGSDIIQNSFNFLADGYHELPGYNSAGNRYRFVNFDSSGDAQGRSAFTDPRLLPTITGNGTIGQDGVKYIKQSDVKLLNPTISLQAGKDLYVRPSGGSGGGTLALIADNEKLIDVGRSPNPLTAANQTNANNNLGSGLYRVQVATDRQLIATSAVGGPGGGVATNAPTTLSAEAILKIYNNQYKLWGDIPGWGTGAVPGSDPADAGETIIPLTLPSDAGMWNTFVATVKAQNGIPPATDPDLRANPNSIQVQQNDPTAITSLPAAQRANAIVPFPRGRYRTLNAEYYTDASVTNAYNVTPPRSPVTAAGIQLLDLNSGTDSNLPESAYGGNFPYNAIFRASDLSSSEKWQPGSTLNWVQALFYNPGGADPFVRTPAGEALLEAAGVEPDYHVFGTDNAEIDLD